MAKNELVCQSTKSYSVENALAFLRTSVEIINLSPLIISHHPLPSPPSPFTSSYRVTDQIPLLFGLTTTTTFTVFFEPISQGVNAIAKANGGVVVKSVWEVLEDGIVRERGEIEAPWWCRWYVVWTWRGAHMRIIERLEEKLAAMDKKAGADVCDC